MGWRRRLLGELARAAVWAAVAPLQPPPLVRRVGARVVGIRRPRVVRLWRHGRRVGCRGGGGRRGRGRAPRRLGSAGAAEERRRPGAGRAAGPVPGAHARRERGRPVIAGRRRSAAAQHGTRRVLVREHAAARGCGGACRAARRAARGRRSRGGVAAGRGRQRLVRAQRVDGARTCPVGGGDRGEATVVGRLVPGGRVGLPRCGGGEGRAEGQ
mmetsp:Transcript_15119/g.43374  ORF Transcript_15119/g.43374 Transcript_15119/m.43374 type:complete len:213 (-) Transcript_15119:407-1045(-)